METNKHEIARTATDALKVLWKQGFFQSWKRKAAIVERLDKTGHHFSDAELGMALMRATHLTRRGKRGSYEYIQKYPFVTDHSDGIRTKKGSRK